MTKLSFILVILLAQLGLANAFTSSELRQYEQQTGVYPTYGNQLKLYQNGDVKEALLKVIEGAREFLLINLLSIECDAATEPFIQIIEKKALAGTTVLLNVNRGFSYLTLGCLSRLEKSQVQIQKTETHSSYWINDQDELLIGSQSLARMFLLADGRNHLDRDVMLYVKGPLAHEGVGDFVSHWPKPEPQLKARWLKSRASDTQHKENPCYFLSESSRLGIRTWSNSLLYWIPRVQKSVLWTGVKTDFGKHPRTIAIRDQIKTASEKGVHFTYFGNGLGGGNGELTMVLEEWIQIWDKHWLPVASLLRKIKDQDSKKKWSAHQSEYKKWKDIKNLSILLYDQFVHHKVWNIDEQALLVGSANLADDTFEKFSDSGVLCFDKSLMSEWKKAQQTDLSYAEPFN